MCPERSTFRSASRTGVRLFALDASVPLVKMTSNQELKMSNFLPKLPYEGEISVQNVPACTRRARHYDIVTS